MNTELIFKYLSDLQENNNREWYHQHKTEYKEANAQFEALVQELILALGQTDSSIIQNVPASYDQEHPQAAYLKYKSWYLEYPVKDEELLDIETFLPKMVQIFEAMKPFNDYLNHALADFKMPTR